MRMAIHPGRSGRGLMLNRKPRYLMLDPPELPFGNRRTNHGNPYGVLRTQYSECEMGQNDTPKAEILKDIFSLDPQMHMEEIPISTNALSRRSSVPQSLMYTNESKQKYMTAIRIAKKK